MSMQPVVKFSLVLLYSEQFIHTYIRSMTVRGLVFGVESVHEISVFPSSLQNYEKSIFSTMQYAVVEDTLTMYSRSKTFDGSGSK